MQLQHSIFLLLMMWILSEHQFGAVELRQLYVVISQVIHLISAQQLLLHVLLQIHQIISQQDHLVSL